MVDNSSSTLNTSTNISINIGEEKSVFERAIIEAFKQKHSKQIYEKLTIALDEIKFMVNEISSQSQSINSGVAAKKCLLNKNIMDKFSRIIERKFFNVNILIAKIFENLLDPDNFEILSPDIDLLVNLANEVLNLLDSIKSTIVSRQLEKKSNSFLNFLSNLQGLSDEQRTIINELINGFPNRNSSSIYQNFEDMKEKILRQCRNHNIEEKLEGINMIMDSFGNTASLEEQFDLLLDKVPALVKAIIHQPNPEYKEAYFQLGNFICSMLYATKFKVDAFLPDFRINHKEINRNYFFLFAGDEMIDEYSKDQISFLHETVYELTTQKEILVKCENIFSICNLIINTLSIYETIFDLQFVCYIILKRIYFTFPQFRKNIEDTLAVTLVNLCSFQDAFEKENSEECKLFIHYLLKKGEEDLKHKIMKRVEARKVSIDLKCEVKEADLGDVEYEQLRFSDFNLRIGYPNSYEVDAGSEMSKYIEVHHPNSLVYVGFATQANDITLHLLKYIPNDEVAEINEETQQSGEETQTEEESEEYTDKGHFKLLLKLDRIDSSLTPVKIVMFVTEPGTYKLVFDNTFSWFTSKTMRHRLSVLRPLSEIDFEKKVDFSQMKKEIKPVQVEVEKESKVSSLKEENLPHSNKVLTVKIDGQNKAFKVGKISYDEKLIRENPSYVIIPVILTKNSIRIVRTVTDEHGNETEDIKEIKLESNLESESLPYSQVFEEKMNKYLDTLSEVNNKIIFLNLYILNKKSSIVQSDSSSLPITTDENYKFIFSKLGFYPEKLVAKYQNLKLVCCSLADSCILYHLYEKLINDQILNNSIHIHFDKYQTQPCLYFEGVINDKFSGFKYDENKTLVENVDNIIDFINKVTVIFGSFDLSVSYSDIDEK